MRDQSTQLNKAQVTALGQLAEPDVTGKSALYVNRDELKTIGKVLMELVEMKLLDRVIVTGGWSRFTITQQGRDKWSEVHGEQAG